MDSKILLSFMLNFKNMFLFYSDKVDHNKIILNEEEHLHCTKVLRKNIGDQILITDGIGHIFTCLITDIGKKSTLCTIKDTLTKEIPFPKIAIAIAPTKNVARLEWFIEKAVEIGISDIYFLHTLRTERKTINQDRINKIIVSAMKQSLNVYRPNMRVFKNIKELLDNLSDDFTQKFIAYCDGPVDVLGEICKKNFNSLLLIGPEGDFTQEEINHALKRDFRPVTLGKSRLRTETAGIVGLMMMR